MEQFIFNILVSFLVGIPSGIVSSYIYGKLKSHSNSDRSKSGCELDIKIKLKRFK